MAAPVSTNCIPGLSGRLYRYQVAPHALQAFESPETHEFDCFVIYIGGLTDGLLACSYVEPLARSCASLGWACVQPVLSSSYTGYGTGSLSRDAGELANLLTFLRDHRGLKQACLVGHSTGCQDAVFFMRNAEPEIRSLVTGCVLQAPVSDREAAALENEDVVGLLHKAERMVAENRAHEILTLHYGFVPITATRYISLFGRLGDDDMFSSDLTDKELQELLSHMSGTKTLIAFSGGDEYVPATVDKAVLVKRIMTAMGDSATAVVLDDATHNLAAPPQAMLTFLSSVKDFLKQLG
eukprot:gene24653-29991_t